MDRIEIKNLSFSYGDKKVLDNLNLQITADRPVVLLGESGIGKTTLLRLLLGFIKPEQGEITGLGETDRISVMYQEDRLFPQLTVYKNLKLVNRALTREKAAKLLSELKLEESVLDKLPSELSGGMRRRAALARALIFEAEAVFMDEPFQGLDAESRTAALSAAKKYTCGRPLLIITHEPEDAEFLGAEAVRIENISGTHGDEADKQN